MGSRPHARLGASGAHRWLRCPGSINLSAGQLDYESEWAREGSAAHALAELRWKGAPEPAEIGGVSVTVEMRAAVEHYITVLRTLARKSGAAVLTEQRVSLARFRPPEPMYGTADALVILPKRLYVVDFKYGEGVVVDPENNPQLLFYAAGALLTLPEMWDRMHRVHVMIVQPRVKHPLGTVRSWVVPWPVMMLFVGRLMGGAYRTRETDAPLRVGAWCQFCKAQCVCPAYRASQQ